MYPRSNFELPNPRLLMSTRRQVLHRVFRDSDGPVPKSRRTKGYGGWEIGSLIYGIVFRTLSCPRTLQWEAIDGSEVRRVEGVTEVSKPGSKVTHQFVHWCREGPRSGPGVVTE